MRGGWFSGQDYWKVKDYHNGLDIGRYLVKDSEIGDKLWRIACGDYMRFWALLTASTRLAQQIALKERIKGNEYGWIEDYENAEKQLRTTVLVGLELTMAPPRVLKLFSPPPARISSEKYLEYLEQIKSGKIMDFGYGVPPSSIVKHKVMPGGFG